MVLTGNKSLQVEEKNNNENKIGYQQVDHIQNVHAFFLTNASIDSSYKYVYI